MFLLMGLHGWGQVDTLNPLTKKQIADSMFKHLNNYLPTEKLFNRLLFDDTIQSISWNSSSIGNSWNNNPATADLIYGALNELKNMSIDTSLVPSSIQIYDSVSAYIGEVEFDLDSYFFPIGIADFSYDYVDINRNIQQGNLFEDNQVLFVTNPSLIIESKRLSMIAPLFDYFDSEQMGIVFKKENFYSNRKSSDDIVNIELEHNRQIMELNWDEVYEFTPTEDSIQKFRVKVIYSDNSYLETYFIINTPELYLKNELKSVSFPGCTKLHLDGDDKIEISGNKLKWCWIPRCASDKRVFKPYILLTGYRPPVFGQSFRKTWKIYNFEHQSLLNSLRDNNYDVLLVKFNIHAKPYSHGMEQSAELLVKFLELLNELKGGQGSGQENIIQGSSMSADIARLALLRMEKKHFEDNNYTHHHSRLFIAYDANFYGANLPLAYQNQVYSYFYHPAPSFMGLSTFFGVKQFFSTYLFATMQQKTVKELLMYHATAYDDNLFNAPNYQTSYTPTHHWRRQGVLNALDAVDNGQHIFPMPIACRNIAISLGKISETNNVNEDAKIPFNNPGQYWRDFDLGLWKFKIRASKYISGGEYTELFRRKKIGLSWTSFTMDHRLHVTEMQEIDMASGSYLEGTGNVISVANWTYFTLLNIIDGRDYFTHKPVVTALGINKDLWPSNGSMTLNVQQMGLMFTDRDHLIPNQDESNHFGYPNLGRPNDHFQVTPFEAIYVDKKINPHIRLDGDDQTDLAQLNNFILNEVEPWYLGLQNNHVGAQARSNYRYHSYRRAKYQIVVGDTVTPTTDPGEYTVESNGKLTLKSEKIHVKAGVHFKSGSIVHIIPEYAACSDSKSSAVTDDQTNSGSSNTEINDTERQTTSDVNLFPNPTSNKCTIESNNLEKVLEVNVFNLTGNQLLLIFNETTRLDLDTDSLKSGTYILKIRTENGMFSKQLIKL